MKILVLTHEFPPVGGGGGHVAQDLCEGLADLGHELTVITADLIGGVPEELDGFPLPYKLIRVKTLRKDPARASMPAMISFIISAVFRGLFLAWGWKPDIIHVHFAVPSGPIAWFLSRLSGVPYVLTVHLGDVPGGTPAKTDRWFRFVKPFTYPIWRSASRVVAVSQYTRELALKHYQVPIEVIHNGVDLGLYQRERMEVHDPPRIVFAGRFVPQKNPLLVIRTLASLKHLDWELLMMGDGELYEKVKEEVHLNNLESRVILPGWVSPETVKEEFLKSDILFMPSLSEGLPVVGVQALASGLALVVSDIGGFADLVDQGKNGFLCPKDETETYRLHLSSLLNDNEQLHKSRQSSEHKSEAFRLEKIVKKYETAFKDVLENE